MKRYSAGERAWLVENYRYGTLEDTLDAFEAEFGRRPTSGSLVTKASDMGLRKDSTLGHISWTPERIAWFRAYVPGHSEGEISAEHERLFGKPLTRSQVKNAKQRLGVKSGTNGGRFEKGRAGGFKSDEHRRKFMEAGEATRFKKGQIPHNGHQPIGTERIDRDGYTWVKTAMRKKDPRTAHDNWSMKHRLVWEQANGKAVPDGCIVVFADGDRTNFDPENLVLETRSEHAVIARSRLPYHDAETHEVARAIALVKSAKANAKRERGVR